jgi:hypothetical protein
MQQLPLQHENPQITNTNTPTINTTQNTLTPQITSTRGTNSTNVLTTSTTTISTQQQQRSGPQSPIIVGLAAWVPPAGAGVGAAASEIIATPVLNTKTSTSIPAGTVDAFTHSSAASVLPSSQYHNASTASTVPVVTISSLLTPDPRTEELLGALTIDQLSLIEKTVQRVKRKKAKESKKLNSSTEITVNTTNIDNFVSNVVNNNSSTKQNAQIMATNPISSVTFINKGR